MKHAPLLLACTLCAGLALAPATHATERPNILLIMADDLGMECLGAYGGTSYETPHLDALAESGMRFTQCYSNPKCVPSRVNILTGRYGFRTGQEWGHIPDDEITFGTLLQDAGYQTALAGKWQLGLLKDNPDHPREKGFGQFSVWAWHEGPRYWDPLVWENGVLKDDAIADRYGPDVFTDFLIEFMTANRERPFLAYYPMCLPHFAKTGGKYEEPKGPNGDYQTYAEMVARMDARVGRLVAAIDALGLRDETLILFTGDNGTPGQVTSQVDGRTIKGGKGKHTNAGTHVPLIASWPGTTPAGSTCNDLIDFSDFLPTFTDLTGARPPQDRPMDGRSFLPQLQGAAGAPRDWVYTEFNGLGWIRDKNWKLYSDGRYFDMARDPREKKPLSANELAGDGAAAHAQLKQALMDLKQRK